MFSPKVNCSPCYLCNWIANQMVKSQSNLAVGGCIPTLVTLMLISSDNPLPSDQPAQRVFSNWAHSFLEKIQCVQNYVLLWGRPYYPILHLYTQGCLEDKRGCFTLPQTCHQKAVLHVCAGVGSKVWLEDTMSPTYHTVMRKCVSGSRLGYGTLLWITEHQRLGKRRSLRWIQIRWIILHWRWCLPQQNSKVNSSGETRHRDE